MDFTNFKFSRLAQPTEIDARKRATVAFLQEGLDKEAAGSQRVNSQSQQGEPSPTLSEELLSYLRFIEDFPGLPATERDKKGGISLRKGSQWRKVLSQVGLIEEVLVNPGIPGRNFKDIRLTERGTWFLHRLKNGPENR